MKFGIVAIFLRLFGNYLEFCGFSSNCNILFLTKELFGGNYYGYIRMK